MGSKDLANLVTIGLLKTEAADQAEFDGLVRSARARFEDAMNATLSLESRFDLAYNAAHALSLAALRWHGFRPDKRRFVVFQALAHSLDLKPEVWRVLDKCHGHRNLAEYEGQFEVDKQLLVDLLDATQKVLAAVNKLGPISS